MAKTLVGAGLALTIEAVAWFLIIFPGGWSLSTGNSAVILSYVTGLAIIGVAGSIVPLATDRRDTALTTAEQRAETAETASEDAAGASRESNRAAKDREEQLTGEIVGLKGDNSDLRLSKAKFELYTDTNDQWQWRLVHNNGTIIADSGEGYSSKANAQKGLGSVKLNALGAEIDQL